MVVVSTMESKVLIMWLRFLVTLTQPPDNVKVEAFLFREMIEASDLNLRLRERKGMCYTVFTPTKFSVLINSILLKEHL